MRKSVLLIAVAAVASLAAWPSTALAQQGPLGGKVFVSVNFGIQVGDNNLDRTSTFDLYEETATIDINQTINNGAFFDISGAYKVKPNLGVGLAYDFVSNAGDGTVSGSLPHPRVLRPAAHVHGVGRRPRTLRERLSFPGRVVRAIHRTRSTLRFPPAPRSSTSSRS